MKQSSKLAGFLKGSAILVASNMCLKAINFFLLPLYTTYLTPEMLGVSDSITTFTGFLLPLLTMGLDSAYSAFYFDEGDAGRSKKVYTTLVVVFLLVGIVPLFLIPVAGPLSALLFDTNDYGPIVMVACASLSANLWYMPFALELRLRNNMLLFGLSNAIASLLMIGLNILFVSYLQLGPMALILSTLIVNIEQVLFLSLAVRERPRREYFSSSLLKKMLLFSLPLIPMVVMNWVLSLSDRYIILAFQGDVAVGLYGISARIANMANVVISAVQIAYTTFAFSSVGDEGIKRQYRLIFIAEAVVLIFASFALSLFGKEVIGLMASSAYAGAEKALRDLLFAQTLYAMTTVVSYGVLFKKRSSYLAISVSCAAFANLALNFVLIPSRGISGAAFATFVGYLINFGITYWFSEKCYKCDYGLKRVAPCAVVLYLAAFFSSSLPIIGKIIVMALGVLFVFVVFRKMISKAAKVIWQSARKSQ